MRALAILACLWSCGAAQHPATTTDEVAAVRDHWMQAFNATQLDPVIATYANDAVFLPNTGERIVSALAIRELYTRIWKTFTPRISLDNRASERSGDLAYDSGEYREQVTSQAETLELAGSYVFVYRREPAGWRIVQQIWTEGSGSHPVR